MSDRSVNESDARSLVMLMMFDLVERKYGGLRIDPGVISKIQEAMDYKIDSLRKLGVLAWLDDGVSPIVVTKPDLSGVRIEWSDGKVGL